MLPKRTVVLLFYLNLRVILGSNCKDITSCGECIGYASEHCVWCTANNFTSQNGSRCRSYTENPEWCPGQVYNPQYEPQGTAGNGTISPTHMRIKIRPHKPVTFKLKYKPALDQPLDVYFLLDNSGSMEKFKANVSKLAGDLYNNLSSISNNVRMGVGSFIEKPALPYSLSQSNVYSFKNELKLTNDSAEFSKVVNQIKGVSNNDDQEATLDALMQVMVCEEEIGWRNDSLRMIVTSTDAGFHSAGDGKMVGAIKPNSMKCHLKDNLHMGSLEYDYPSVGQINYIASKKQYHNIFLLKSSSAKQTTNSKKDYEYLVSGINNAELSVLKGPKSDIATTIIDYYKKIMAYTKIYYEEMSDVKLAFEPKCDMDNNADCKIGFKGSIEINVTVQMKCPTDGNYKRNIEIKPKGLNLDETLLLDLEVICNCECENEKILKKSPECNNFGIYQCGICKCDQNRDGENCECEISGKHSHSEKCQNIFCSGRGMCRCGKCQCNDGYDGENCEKSDSACQRLDEDKPCSGHGVCRKSSCVCDDGWENKFCSCSTSKMSCYENEDQEMCSGNGDCKCEKCECKEGYSGDYCGFCEKCSIMTCTDLKEYAYCVFTEDKIKCDQKYNEYVKDIESQLISKDEKFSERLQITCRIPLENDSSIVYDYYLEPKTNKWTLAVQNTLQNPIKINLWVTVAAVVGSVLLAGLIMLVIWKCSVEYLDNKEYKKFEAEALSAGFNVTLPTYKDPVVVFRNPRYRVNSTSNEETPK